MASNIDPTKPADNTKASKSDLRANLSAAKDEIETLQRQVRLPFYAALVLGRLTSI